MSLPDGNPRIPEGINASEEHPLKEFLQLLAGVSLGLVVLVAALSFLAGALAPLVPFRWEKGLGSTLEGYMDEPPGELEDAGQALVALSQQLLQSSLAVAIDGQPAAEEVPPEAMSFHLVDAAAPNAFATLGGHVIVTDELLDSVQSENGLAMVIAHEIAHVQLRHPIEAAGRGVVIQLTLTALLGSTGNTMLGQVLNSGGALTSLGFNRDMELEADARALAILRQHYGHVGGADEFFLAMSEQGNEARWLEFVSTHPATDTRLEQIRAAMAADTFTAGLSPLPPALIEEAQKDAALVP